jgi:SAM-dependent methyltransferase
MSSLFDEPALYDALMPIGPSCTEHYCQLARQADGDVLELACGSGLLLAPLAATGRRVTGLDNAISMLDAARARADAARVSVELELGDMRSFALGRRFALIIIARNSLQHFHSTDDLIGTLATARAHLAPGGLIAFDVFVPNLEWLARPAGTRHQVMQREHADYGTITVEQESNYDVAAQVQRATWFITTSTGHTTSFPLHIRSIFPQELPLLVRAAGLELVERFGDFTRVPFDATSPRQVCLAR